MSPQVHGESDRTCIIYNLLRKANSWVNDIVFTKAAHCFKTKIIGILLHPEEEEDGNLMLIHISLSHF